MSLSRKQRNEGSGEPGITGIPKPGFSASSKPAIFARETDAQVSSSEFDTLFYQQWERVCRVVYRLVGDWQEAEDLAIDAFLKLYHRLPDSSQNPAGWLYQTATHLGLNALRARKRRQHYEEEAGNLQLFENQGQDTAQAAEQSLTRAQVRQALSRLKPRSAQILILRYSGLSYAEIAQALEVQAASVGTMLARAEQEFETEYLAAGTPPSLGETD